MKNIIVVLVVYLVTFITSHGTSVNRLMRHKIKERRRQIQGENTNDLEPYQRHPYLLLIGYPLFFFNQSRSHFIPECVGVFITPQVVLTVADGCVRSDLTGFWIRYSVRSSISTSIRSNQSGHGIDVETLRAATNPRLDEERNAAEPFTDGRITSNIGLLVLQEPLTLDPMPVLHLPEPEEIDLLNSSQNLTVVGMTSPRGNDDRSDLVTAERVRNIEPCMLPRIPGVHAVCADNFTLIKCLGGLGAPLFAHTPRGNVVLAIASEKRDCHGVEADPNLRKKRLFAPLNASMPWIMNTIVHYTRCHCMEDLHYRWTRNTDDEKDINDAPDHGQSIQPRPTRPPEWED